MLSQRLLQEQFQGLLADVLGRCTTSTGGPSQAIITFAGSTMASVAAVGSLLGAAAARLERSATGASASTSGRPALHAGAGLVASSHLWAAATGSAGQHNRRQGRLLQVGAAAGGQWPLPGPPSSAAGLHSAQAPAVAAQPAVQPASWLASSDPMVPPATYGGPPSGPLYDSHFTDRAESSLYATPSRLPLAAAPPLLPAGVVSVQGTVQKITYRSADTAYIVFRLQLAADSLQDAVAAAARAGAAGGSKAGRGKQRVITVVGNLPQVAVGQSLLLSGSWVEHRQYGQQLRATDLQELTPASDGEMVAYLGGGAIPGVGPVTAQRMVDKWGSEIEAKLSSRSAVRYLEQCEGIGHAKAEKIKQAWDATKGTREGVIFLKEHGIPLPLAQRVAARYGPHTVCHVRGDPYAVLAGFGLPFSKVDMLAGKMGAPPDLVSRAAMAVQRSLAAAAIEEGHTYLPWHRLEKDAGQLLRDMGLQHNRPWEHYTALHLVAQHMHASGMLVAEPATGGCTAAAAAVDTHTHAAAAGEAAAVEAASAAQQAAGSPQGELVAARSVVRPAPRAHPAFEGISDLKAYLGGKLNGVSATLVDSMLSSYGEGVLEVLDAEHADVLQQLSKCRKVGAKTAEKIKLAWEEAHGVTLATGGGASGSGAAQGAAGLTMQQLQTEPPELGFKWGPTVRCYSPHLHGAEVTVAQRSLHKAGAYRQASSRQLNRVRKWVAANQSTTDVQLNEGQVRAIVVASDAPLMVVTGGPGCGKTTAVQTIVKLWAAQKKIVRIAAPTGRAAHRMGEIQSIEPCTIHRLLGYQPRRSSGGNGGGGSPGGGGGGLADLDAAVEEAGLGTSGYFQYNRSNPLPADAVLVDEASMLSLPLAAALFDALRPRCQLVLVGDVDQLPPVGPGSVLQNLIDSQLVPVVDLREIFRQAAQSAIITSALAVRRGDVPMLQRVDPTPQALDASTSDALLVSAMAPEDLAVAVRETVVAMRQAHGDLNGEEEADLQVISPMRKGPAGTLALNPMLQALLNPPSRGKAELARSHAHTSSSSSGSGSSGGGAVDGDASTAASVAAAPAEGARVFRVGDRVLQLVNNYDKEVFNGDQGRVVACNPGERQLVVHFPHLDKSTAGGEQGSLRRYQGVEQGQLELAYAITVHKAQGGEVAHVVLALSPQHGRMLTRRLLYTGLTRAKRQLVVVTAGGDTAADPLVRAVRRKDSDARLTTLQLRLEQGRQEGGLPELATQSYSNEEQMLAQAAQWQHLAEQQAAEQRLAAQQAAVAAEAEQCHNDWAATGAASSSSSVCTGGQIVQPSLEQLAVVQEQLEQQEGCSAKVAATWVELLRQRSPEALQDWGRARAALDWLQTQLAGSVTAEQLVRRAPELLAVEVGRLQSYWRFLESRQDFVASGSSSSMLESLHALRSSAAEAQAAGEQQQVERAA